jgi:hypothetical protein
MELANARMTAASRIPLNPCIIASVPSRFDGMSSRTR